ncbi:hypothetical protein E1293_29345 [Actinomadura darangshiensis]|uniref:Uncharacterized protein n=1 Tax=Actinomadura darangshiensis TaxID=705336 RepID=A0A4R5ARP7_9ACTN|nr:hypothetical protein [Actinomadura darangshiensis]TDD74560.1 hypothetical protein E1293_29345 [Actinomadura darangshiensis]
MAFDNFAFAVPQEWRQSSDQVGQFWQDGSGTTVLRESVYTMTHCPDAADLRRSTDNEKVTSYTPLKVPGAAGGARVGFDRPSYDVRDATNLIAWLKDCQTKFDAEIYETGPVVDEIASTVVAQEDE